MTSAPSAARRNATLRPIRLAAPVTSATFPASGDSDTSSLSFAGCRTYYTFSRLCLSFSINPSVLFVGFLRDLCVKFRKALHRGRKESQRNRPFSSPRLYHFFSSHLGVAGG